MATILPVDYVLANVLRKKDKVTFGELGIVRKNVEQACPGVVVEVSSPAIRSALACYPFLFEQEGGQINRAKSSDKYFSTEYVENRFADSVPPDVHSIVVKILTG